MTDLLAKNEADKYRRMWEVPEYRRVSPGEKVAASMRNFLPLKAGDILADFGAGTGRASKIFLDQGLNVIAIDIAPNACEIDDHDNLTYIEMCLWHIPENLRVDWAFCCDVLEHIPSVKVPSVLRAILQSTKRGGLLTIAHFPDSMGKRIGETLHLTVKPWAWWAAELTVAAQDLGREFTFSRMGGGDRESTVIFTAIEGPNDGAQ